MCYIKNACLKTHSLFDAPTLPSTPTHPLPLTSGPVDELSMMITNPWVPSCSLNSSKVLLGVLYNSVVANSQAMMKLQSDIDSFDLMVKECLSQLSHKQQEELIETEEESVETWRAKDKIIERNFGARNYRYKLKLKSKVPSTLYKERNFNMGITLVDHAGKQVMNSNMLNIGVAACDLQGHWVPDTDEGESFIRGKAEVELYHGEASFLKVYTRDVTRNLPHGKTHLEVYVKPSLIKFSQSNSTEKLVDASEIEPLLIKDITVRAKKKLDY